MLVIALIGENIKKIYNSNIHKKERADALKILNIVDGILLLKEDYLTDAINLLKPLNLVLGNERTSRDWRN